MSLKTEAIKRFLTAARSLANQGLSREAIMNFAKNEFGEITELFQKQIDNIFKRPASGIEKIKIKDEVFDDTVIKLPVDDTGQPFNPNNPLKDYSKKPKKAGKGQFTKAEYLIQRLKNTIKENPDDKYVQENFPNMIKELEANPDLAKNENVFRELGGDLPSNQKITVYDDDTLDFATLKPTKKFRLNKERFQKDFNVSDEEVEKILKMSSEEQRDVVNKYIDKDFKERIQLSDYDVTDLEPNAEGGIVGYYTGGMVDVEPNLSDIGHGSDALMARTRLISPGAQGTTSTGLNYLLAEDNDNIRVPFSSGESARYENYYIDPKTGELKKKPKLKQKAEPFYPKDFDIKDYYDPKPYYPPDSPLSEVKFAQGGRIGFSKGKLADAARRKFMKAAGAGAAGLAALKTGLINLAKDAGPKVEAVKESVGGVPDYFFRLVDKIRFMGDETLASQDKAIAKKYKDYVMEEDFAGNITIVKSGEDLQGNKLEDVYMSYKVDDVSMPDKKGFKKVEDYEEFTARPDMEGKMKDVEPGVPDEVIQEAGDVEAMTLKKASGGIAKLLGE